MWLFTKKPVSTDINGKSNIKNVEKDQAYMLWIKVLLVAETIHVYGSLPVISTHIQRKWFRKVSSRANKASLITWTNGNKQRKVSRK